MSCLGFPSDKNHDYAKIIALGAGTQFSALECQGTELDETKTHRQIVLDLGLGTGIRGLGAQI